MPISKTFVYPFLIVVLLLQLTTTIVHAGAWSTDSHSVGVKPKALGPQPTIVILAEFKDLAHQRSREDLAAAVFRDLNNYVTEASYSSTWVVGNITVWVKLPSESSSYGRDFGPFIDVEIRSLIADSIRAVDSSVNFKLYRHIIIVHAGTGQETTGTLSDIWSGYMTCRPPVYADGVILTNAIIVPEKEAREIDPLGIYVHEFMHSLGLPDLYPDSKLKKSKHLGPWDVMDTGMRNGEPKGSRPSHPSAWSKITLNWPVKTVAVYAGSVEEITIGPLETVTECVQAVILPSAAGRYYLIEVRLQVGFDSYLPSKGVIVTEIDERRAPTSGMVRVIDANPSTPDLKNAAFQVGQTYNDASKLVRISVTAESAGFTVLIDRRIQTSQHR